MAVWGTVGIDRIPAPELRKLAIEARHTLHRSPYPHRYRLPALPKSRKRVKSRYRTVQHRPVWLVARTQLAIIGGRQWPVSSPSAAGSMSAKFRRPAGEVQEDALSLHRLGSTPFQARGWRKKFAMALVLCDIAVGHQECRVLEISIDNKFGLDKGCPTQGARSSL